MAFEQSKACNSSTQYEKINVNITNKYVSKTSVMGEYIGKLKSKKFERIKNTNIYL